MKYKFNSLSKNIIISATSILFITGCAHVGLSAIPQTREGYNIALSNSDNEQFLLNIVRIHFGQTPYFVNVDNMVTQSTLKATSGVDSQLSNSSASIDPSGLFWRVSPAVEFSQTPTITYSPLQGTQFVSGMLTPINLDNLLLLLQSGWSTSSILKLTTDKIGTLANATSALRATSTKMPHQSEFNHFVDTLDHWEADEKIEYAATTYLGQKAILIDISDEKAAVELSKILHLSKPYQQIIFSQAIIGKSDHPENVIHLQTRSFFSMLNFLSKGVMSTDDEMEASHGVSSKIKTASIDYNWNALTKNLFLVSASDEEPKNVVVKINFENDWYYIPQNDKTSKATLILLRMIYSLQIGELKASLPLITIPTK